MANSLAKITNLVKHKYFTSTAAFDAYFAGGEYSIYDICFVDDSKDGAYISCRGQVFGKQSGIIGDVSSLATQVATNKSDIATNAKAITALEEGKVDKAKDHSLVSDTLITKLEGLDDQATINNNIATVATTAATNLTTAKTELEAKITTNATNISGVDARVKTIEGKKLVELGTDGYIPSSVLPSYVDDVLEYATLSALESNGTKESGKIYVTLDNNKTYRWSGTAYVEISASIALGETESTAYAGNKGKQNAENIAALQTKATTAESEIATLKSRADDAETNISANAADIASLKTASSNNATNITDLTTKVTANTNNINTLTTATTANTSKLADIQNGAQVNVIETVKLNGTELKVSEKAVNIEVTAKTLGVGDFVNLTPATLPVSNLTQSALDDIITELNKVIAAACWVE